MKEQVIFYGVCLAISFAAVAITSFVKLIVCAIAKKCGGDLSGNSKEYIFTPMAIIIAAAGLYVWLDKFCKMAFDEKFILTVGCFSVGTMLVYLLLFQPTRKFAMKIIRAIINSKKVPAAIEVFKNALTEAEVLLNGENENLQSTAVKEVGATEKPPDALSETDAEAEKLRNMVKTIINNQ